MKKKPKTAGFSNVVVKLVLVAYLAGIEIPTSFVFRHYLTTFPYTTIFGVGIRMGLALVLISLAVVGKLVRQFIFLAVELVKTLYQFVQQHLIQHVVYARDYIVVGVLITLFGFNMFTQYTRFNDVTFADDVKTVNFWPTLPSSYFDFSRKLYDYGSLDGAQTLLGQSSQALDNYKVLGISSVFEDNYKSTYAYVNQRDILESQLNDIEKHLAITPYSAFWLSRKAEVESELMMDDDLSLTLETMHWIDPDLDLSSYSN